MIAPKDDASRSMDVESKRETYQRDECPFVTFVIANRRNKIRQLHFSTLRDAGDWLLRTGRIDRNLV